MTRTKTIARFGIDYQIGDFYSAVEKLVTSRISSPKEEVISHRLTHNGWGFWTGSGRQALRLILQAMKLQPKAKVAVPLYCDFSVACAIKTAGCTPVFVDVDESTLTIDPASLAQRRADLAAIVVPHFFGHVADIAQILHTAGSTPVIEDLAHAPFSMFQGKSVGTFGVASFYSFGSTKPFPAGGGGLAVSNDAGLASALAMEVKALERPKFSHMCWNVMAQAAKAAVFRRPYYGLAGRTLRPHIEARHILEPVLSQSGIHPHQIIIMMRQLARMPKVLAAQRRNSLRLISLLAGIKKVILPTERPGSLYNFHIFPVIVASGEEARFIRTQMLKRHIDTSQIYEGIVQQAYALGYKGDCPVSESVAGRMLTLPNYAALQEQDIDNIAAAFIGSLNEYRSQHSKVTRTSLVGLQTE